MNQELLDFKWMENDKPFFCFIPEFYYSISQPKFNRLANTLTFKYNLINSYLSPNSKILDPCSGSGFGAWMLKNSGHDVTCIENNPFLVWVTKKRGINSILEDSILDIELKNDEYDGIVFIDAIEHFYEEDQNKILSKFFNILKPGGVLVIDTPFSKKTRFVSNEHKRELSWNDFEQLVISNGFKNTKRSPLIWDGFVTAFSFNKEEELRSLIS